MFFDGKCREDLSAKRKIKPKAKLERKYVYTGWKAQKWSGDVAYDDVIEIVISPW